MMNLLVMTAVFIFNLSGVAQASEPNQDALKISLAAKNPELVRAELVKSVKKMKPSQDGLITQKLIDDTLSLLEVKGYPKFVFQVAQNRNQDEIVKNLLAALPEDHKGVKSFAPAEWAEAGKNQIFPKGDPMPILAAAGSSLNGHHSYPGGLIYHLSTTASTNLNWLQTYEKTFHYHFKESEKNLVFISGIWHDSAKAYTIPWKADGSLIAKEGKIAWAGSHHVLSAAEALFRGHSKELVMTIAASHDPANENEESFQKVLAYLVATSVVAGKDLASVGVKKEIDHYALLNKPSVFMFIQNLGDGDWVLIDQALKSIKPVLEQKAVEWKYAPAIDPVRVNAFVNQVLSRQGELIPYHLWQQSGEVALKEWVEKENPRH